MRSLLRLATLIILLSALAPPLGAAAQSADSLDPLRRAVAGTRPLTRVRVELRDGRRLSGVLGPTRADALEITDPSGTRLSVRYEDVTQYWRRGRATAHGAVVVGILGAGFGALLGVVAAGLCEYDCPSTTTSAMAGGAILVGAAGAGVGAIVGAAIPRWRQMWRGGRSAARGGGQAVPLVSVETQRDSSGSPVPLRARRVGEFTVMLTAGYAAFPRGGLPAEQGPGAGASLGLVFLKGQVGFGPELGVMSGTTGTLRTFAGVGRVHLRRSGSAEPVPYLVVGAGAYGWSDRETMFTAVLGGGTTLRGRWRVEARWNPVLQYGDPYNPHPTLLTVGIGKVLAW